ncbi:MAG: hypothetical protein AVDCRST_MAG68-3907 [uncultured Gemmatimonadetes bacterium]|uniref:Uncharacterized protein n=1 Tax=uncultured Gemmatimonadota bacterium TaxID=203437 RepID=A0A6J4M9T9_9BACT|nr:MAG: hypothetical protein AVDCRST_MAG68-3907 [uncultured Gemmatimonadota bacterium]
MARRAEFVEKRKGKVTVESANGLRGNSIDTATLNEDSIARFEAKWEDLAERMNIVPGKQVLQDLRTELKDKYVVNLTDAQIIDAFRPEEVPSDFGKLLEELDRFRQLGDPI